LVAGGVAGLIVSVEWPFTKQRTIGSLEDVSGCRVEIRGFREVFFPHPGYDAEEVRFQRGSGANEVSLAKVGKVATRGSWVAVLSFTHRLMRIDLHGLEVRIPKRVPSPIPRSSKEPIATTVSDLFAAGAVLEIAPRENQTQPQRFDFPALHLSNVAKNKPIRLDVRVMNPHLMGKVEVTGLVGPIPLKHLDSTKLDGRFRIAELNLGSYRQIAGTVSGDGHFTGELGRTDITGHIMIPDFEVTRSHHRENLAAEYHVSVNGLSGDVGLISSSVELFQTKLIAHGTIAGQKGKTISLDVTTADGRIQDLLHVFAKSDPAPVEGTLDLRAHVVVPPEKSSFLQRLRIDGDFQIAHAMFTHPATEMRLNDLSVRASGRKGHENEKQVSAEMASHVRLRQEIATLTGAVFTVPGAVASGGGTYNLEDEVLNLKGNVAMHATLSRAETGVKSVLVVPLDPFFKKGNAGAVLPIRITGTYSHPKFRLRL
jgi:hypothetical protein